MSRRRSAILLQTEVNLLQASLDHQSALVSFEALQQAPALGEGQPVNLRGSNVTPTRPRCTDGTVPARIRQRILISEQETRRVRRILFEKNSS